MPVWSGFCSIDLFAYLYISTIQSLLLEFHNKTKLIELVLRPCASLLKLFWLSWVLCILEVLNQLMNFYQKKKKSLLVFSFGMMLTPKISLGRIENNIECSDPWVQYLSIYFRSSLISLSCILYFSVYKSSTTVVRLFPISYFWCCCTCNVNVM